jgi:manganese/zinc/iron transport system substrate-binding protein
LLACAALLCLAGLGGCGDSAGGETGGKLRIVATTTMLEDLARRIAGPDAQVTGIMKPGEDPHIYDVRPQDAELIRNADVVLMNGFHLEATLTDIAAQHAGDARVVHLAEASGIEALKSDGAASGAPDPHLWMNAAYFRRYAEVTRDAIIAADPEHAEGYRLRADAYIAELDALDKWIREQVATVPRERRVIVTSHDAFQYFGAAYDVDVYGVIGISTEQQPRPQDLQRL